MGIETPTSSIDDKVTQAVIDRGLWPALHDFSSAALLTMGIGMSEESMERSVQEALAREGIADEVLVAGQFSPRGHSGALALGGMAGDSLGGIGGAVGAVAGMAGATEGTDALRGLPDHMVVGVTADAVYGFAGATKAGTLAFKISREHLKATVHQRVDVRVLELADEETGSKIELEGNRLPITHSKDVISELAG